MVNLRYINFLILFLLTLINYIYYFYYILDFEGYTHIKQQSDYMLDFFYYWQQGFLLEDSHGLSLSLIDNLEFAPTINSIGIVTVNSIFPAVGIKSIYLIPIFFFCIYLFLIFKTNFGLINPIIVFLSLFFLSPLCFSLSKEGIALLGFFLLLCTNQCNSLYKKIILIILSFLLLMIARYEIILILFLAIILYYQFKFIPAKINYFILTILFVIFHIYLKDKIVDTVKIYENHMLLTKTGGLAFGGYFDNLVLIYSDNEYLTFALRILISPLIILKWFLSVFIDDLSNINIVNSSLNQFSCFLCIMFFVFKNSILNVKNLILENKLLFIIFLFCILYYLVYITFTLHQPTRQLMFVFFIAMISYEFIALDKE